jgi:hypothetical protein
MPGTITPMAATSDFGAWFRLLWSVPLHHGHGKLQMKGAYEIEA